MKAKAADDAQGGERIAELKRWGKAEGKLRAFSLERLGHEKLIEEGKWPALEEITSGEYPDPEAPQEAISLNFYAEHLHWDKEKAAIIAEREKDAFEGPQTRLFFLQAAFGMTHLYIGYSLLIGAALGEAETAATD